MKKYALHIEGIITDEGDSENNVFLTVTHPSPWEGEICVRKEWLIEIEAP